MASPFFAFRQACKLSGEIFCQVFPSSSERSTPVRPHVTSVVRETNSTHDRYPVGDIRGLVHDLPVSLLMKQFLSRNESTVKSPPTAIHKSTLPFVLRIANEFAPVDDL